MDREKAIRLGDSIVKNAIDSLTVGEEAITFIQARYSPEDVFDENELIEWAENNGFTKTS